MVEMRKMSVLGNYQPSDPWSLGGNTGDEEANASRANVADGSLTGGRVTN